MAKLAPCAKLAFLALDGGSSGRPNSCAAGKARKPRKPVSQAHQIWEQTTKPKQTPECESERGRTEVVDDEASVGAAAGGLPEVGLAVGQARGGQDLRGAVLDEVAGVG
jgi:hypothetical protein